MKDALNVFQLHRKADHTSRAHGLATLEANEEDPGHVSERF